MQRVEPIATDPALAERVASMCALSSALDAPPGIRGDGDIGASAPP